MSFIKFSLAIVALLSITNTNAQTVAGPVTVTRVRTGWDAEAFAVETGQSILNPKGCSTPDGYISDVSQAGYKTHYAAILLAYSTGRPVQIVISNTVCGLAGRPKIIGVNLQP